MTSAPSNVCGNTTLNVVVVLKDAMAELQKLQVWIPYEARFVRDLHISQGHLLLLTGNQGSRHRVWWNLQELVSKSVELNECNLNWKQLNSPLEADLELYEMWSASKFKRTFLNCHTIVLNWGRIYKGCFGRPGIIKYLLYLPDITAFKLTCGFVQDLISSAHCPLYEFGEKRLLR